jgi:predicted Zn finger-like uncharacterized protein
MGANNHVTTVPSNYTADGGTHDGESFLPFLVESKTDVSHDPVAGAYGTRTSIVEETCPECGYDRAVVSHAVLPDVYSVRCNACDHVIEQG